MLKNIVDAKLSEQQLMDLSNARMKFELRKKCLDLVLLSSQKIGYRVLKRIGKALSKVFLSFFKRVLFYMSAQTLPYICSSLDQTIL